MFTTISWGQYITTIMIVVICYYSFVGFKYFRWEMLSLIGIKKVDVNHNAEPTVENLKKSFIPENPKNYLPKTEVEVDISPLVQSFMDEIQAYINEAAGNAMKPELLYSFQLIASKYLALKGADSKEELLQFVLAAANDKFPELFESEELKNLFG